MTDQPALFTEPPWTAAWPTGTKVRNQWTNATGEVVSVDPLGRHLLIRWTSHARSHDCRHGSDRGLELL